MEAVLVADAPAYDSGAEYWLSTTDQVIVTRNRALLDSERVRSVATAIPRREGLPVFTDDYFNLVKILKR
jgi:hypothetical protein